MPSRVLITGAAGYLGSILCERLLEEGYGVTALDSMVHGVPSLFHLCARPQFEFVRGDARDEGLVARLLRDADVVIPLAAVVGAAACDRDPVLARSVNLDAVRMLMARRSPSQLVVFPTTNSGYGTRSGGGYCTEETPLEPVSLYGRTKADAESEVLSHPNTITFRLATVFGMSPRMRIDLLVNHFTWAAVTDGYLVVFEKGFRRNYVHVRDVADAFVHALGSSAAMVGRCYNAGLESANLSKEDLAKRIQAHVPGFYVHFSEVGSDPDRRDYLVSNLRLREAGFEARRSLDDGIRELLQGYRMLSRWPLGNA